MSVRVDQAKHEHIVFPARFYGQVISGVRKQDPEIRGYVSGIPPCAKM